MSKHQINEILEKLSKVAGHCDLVTVKNLGCGPEVGSIEIVEGSTTRVYQLDTEGYVQHKMLNPDNFKPIKPEKVEFEKEVVIDLNTRNNMTVIRDEKNEEEKDETKH